MTGDCFGKILLKSERKKSVFSFQSSTLLNCFFFFVSINSLKLLTVFIYINFTAELLHILLFAHSNANPKNNGLTKLRGNVLVRILSK